MFLLLLFFFNFPFGKIFWEIVDLIHTLFLWRVLSISFKDMSITYIVGHGNISYPITEMLFSIFRKIFLKYSPLRPDVNHLHHLIFKKLRGNLRSRNNKASLMMLPFCIIPFLLTYFSINYNLNDNFLKFLIYVVFYVICYLFLFHSIKGINSNL